MDSERKELEKAVIRVVAAMTLCKEHEVTLATPIHNPGFSPYMKMVIVRELEKLGFIDPIPDEDLRGWVAASRGWLNVESVVAAVRHRLRTEG